MGNKIGDKLYTSSPAARAMMRNVAVNVRALRQQNGWSIAQLASHANLTIRMVENIEAESTCPSFVAVAWLAEAFDITLNRLCYYPREALDGRVQDKTNGRFIVPPPKHPPTCECAECWQAMEAGGR